MSNYQQQLLEYIYFLLDLDRQLEVRAEPLAAHLLCDTAHGEAIIEASANLRKAIMEATASVSVTIAKD